MSRSPIAMLCLLLALPARGAPPRAVAGPVFALVVGVNRPIGNGTQRLLHADDDAILFHRLLATVGYSRLLVVPDVASTELHGPLPEAQAPTWANLERSLDALFASMRRARARGLRPHFLFVYSGHGDLERGQGYLALADGRLTSSDLARRVLARSPAVANHVIIDACRSYYLVHGRHPRRGEAREAGSLPRSAGRARGSDTARQGSLARRFPNTGFVLSTASAESSHEWNELQAGVFSHEVRSGLMGAADVDRDGRIAYDELWAFIRSANARITSARFRPTVYIRPPRGTVSSALLDWRRFRGASITVSQGGRYVLEDDDGVRLADFHASPSHVVTLRLPHDARPDSLLYIHDLERLMQYLVELEGGQEHHRLVDLSSEPSNYHVKGRPHFYSRIFAQPFGAQTYRALMVCNQLTRGDLPCTGRRLAAVLPPTRSRGALKHMVHRPAWRSVVSASAGLRAMTHRLRIDDTTGLDSGWFSALELGGDLFPLAANPGPVGNLGLAGHYYHSIGLTTHPQTGPRSISATLQELRVGLRYRWNLLHREASPELRGGIDTGFQLLQPSTDIGQIPTVRYQFLGLNLLDLRVPIITRNTLQVGLDLGFDYRFVLSGALIDGEQRSSGGFELHGGLVGRLGRWAFSATWFYQRYGFNFDEDSCPQCQDAADLYYGLALRGGFRY